MGALILHLLVLVNLLVCLFLQTCLPACLFMPLPATCDATHVQVARTMAPSVIYVDEAEKVFLSDKKKLREFGSQVCRLRIPPRCKTFITC